MDENEEEIIIKLTPRGQKLFQKLYVYRPIVESIDGDIYTFKCSYSQIIQYFQRFGSNAIIVSPKSLGETFRNFFYYAHKEYKNNFPYKKEN